MTVEVYYTPNYPNAKRVSRKHDFNEPKSGLSFINRMHRMYPDAIIYDSRDDFTWPSKPPM